MSILLTKKFQHLHNQKCLLVQGGGGAVSNSAYLHSTPTLQDYCWEIFESFFCCNFVWIVLQIPTIVNIASKLPLKWSSLLKWLCPIVQCKQSTFLWLFLSKGWCFKRQSIYFLDFLWVLAYYSCCSAGVAVSWNISSPGEERLDGFLHILVFFNIQYQDDFF